MTNLSGPGLGLVACIEDDFPGTDTAGHEDIESPAAGRAFSYDCRGRRRIWPL